jgi:Asp-tRNA(Asn)/Glu-tRNA(Gln) amidotransferase C subunit
LRDAVKPTLRSDFHAKNAKSAKKGSFRIPHSSPWRSWRALRDAVKPTLRSDFHAKNAKSAKKGSFRIPHSLPWRSWRALRDAIARHLDSVSRQERKGRKETQVLDSLFPTLALLARFA